MGIERGDKYRIRIRIDGCEECWDEAFFRSRLTGRLPEDIYPELLAENEQAHTTTVGTDRD